MAGVAQNKDLLRGFWCRVCAVGRGDFASIDRGHSDEHSTIDTNDAPACPDDCRYDIAQSRPCIPDQPPARLQAVCGLARSLAGDGDGDGDGDAG